MVVNMNNSVKAADTFLSLLQDGKMRKSILPNTAPNYTCFDEQRELLQYIRYLDSFAYDDLKSCEVRTYNGDE